MDRLPTSIKGYMTARPSTSRIADNPPTRSCIADDLPMPSRGQCTTDAHCLAPRAPSITDSIPQSMIHSVDDSIIYSLIHSVSPLIIHSILPSTIHSIILSNIRSIILSVTHSVILYDHSLDTEGTPTGHPTRTPPILYSISHSLSHQVSP